MNENIKKGGGGVGLPLAYPHVLVPWSCKVATPCFGSLELQSCNSWGDVVGDGGDVGWGAKPGHG